MPTEVLSPVLRQKFFANSGIPLNGGKLFSYTAGTSTKRSTFRDSAGAGTNTNPIILDYRGEADVWIPPNVGYKFVLAPANDTDPPTNPIWSVDNVTNAQLITLYGGVDSGVANAYVLTFTSNFSAYADGIVIYWIPANTNTGVSTLNVNGLGPLSIVGANGNGLSAGQLQANQPATVMLVGGAWVLLLPQVGVPVRVYKTAGTARASTTTLTADPHLIIPGGTGTFAVEGLLLFNEATTGAGGIQFGLYDTGGASLTSNPKMLLQGSVNGATYTAKASWNVAAATLSVSIGTVSISADNDAVLFRGVLVGNGPGNIGISWAQNSSNVNATALLQGSWLQVTQLS
jgi:hypothetical protein